MKYRVIGDVHGKYGQYKRILDASPYPTIQVGDMGVGFRKKNIHLYEDQNEFYPNPPHKKMVEGNHRFIRGNHDNPQVCQQQSQYIPDGHVEENMMFVGGGLSIDRHMRTEGYTWWRDEELSQAQFYDLHQKYCDVKPDIMITHECPESWASYMCAEKNWQKFHDPSITRQAFQSMFESHQPRIWIHGHWHFNHIGGFRKTLFVCLGELQYADLDTNQMKVEFPQNEEIHQ